MRRAGGTETARNGLTQARSIRNAVTNAVCSSGELKKVRGELIPSEESGQFPGETKHQKAKNIMETSGTSSVTVFSANSSKAVSTVHPISGVSVNRLLKAKEYKDRHGVKGAEGKRQFNAYLRDNGSLGNQSTAALLASGKWLTHELRVNKAGDRITIKAMAAHRAVDGSAGRVPKIDLDNLTAEQIKQIGVRYQLLPMVPATGEPARFQTA